MPVEKQIQFTGDASSLRSELARIDADFDRFSARLKSIQEDAIVARGITRDRDLSDLEGLSRRFEELKDESRALSAIEIPSQLAGGIAKPSEALVIDQDDTVSQASTSEIAVLAPQTQGSLISSPDITNKGITDPDTPLENIEDILRSFKDEFLREFRRSNEYERDYDTERGIHPDTPVTSDISTRDREEEPQESNALATILGTPSKLITAGRSGNIEYAGELAGGAAGGLIGGLGKGGMIGAAVAAVIGIFAKLFGDTGAIHEANMKYRAITGKGRDYDPRAEAGDAFSWALLGMTDDQYLERSTQLRKQLGYDAGDISLYRGIRAAELSYGVSPDALTSVLNVGEFMKKQTDAGAIVGGLKVVTDQFKDGNEKIADYLKTYTALAESQSHRTSYVASSERLLALIGLGTALGGKFADERQAHVFAQMDQAIASPANQYIQAENLRDLSQLLGTTDYIELRKAQAKGLAQPGILSAILEDTKGVDRTTAIIGLEKRLGVTLDSAEKIYKAFKGGDTDVLQILEALKNPDSGLAKELGLEGVDIGVAEDRLPSSEKGKIALMQGYKTALEKISNKISTLIETVGGVIESVKGFIENPLGLKSDPDKIFNPPFPSLSLPNKPGDSVLNEHFIQTLFRAMIGTPSITRPFRGNPDNQDDGE